MTGPTGGATGDPLPDDGDRFPHRLGRPAAYPAAMLQRIRNWFDWMRTNFFALPAVAVVVGFVGARLAVGVETGDWVGRSTVDSARGVLSAAAAATITFASITFSVSLLIMQQGSSQFSPRVVHGLTRDPFNRRVIAIVVGTFTYCLVALLRVRGPATDTGEEVAPDFAVALGVLLAVTAVLAVVAAINHTSRSMDISQILGAVVAQALAASTRGSDDGLRAAPPPAASEDRAPTVIRFDADGWVRHIDRRALLRLVEPGGRVRLEIETGRYAIRATPLCAIWPAVTEDRLGDVTAAARRAIVLGPTRTVADNSAYGVRQLVDVALKALSPGVNDPTTAQDAIFHLGTVLVARLTSPVAPTAYDDGHGRTLLTPHATTDADLAELACAELRRAAAGQPAVIVYLLEMLSLVVDAARANGAHDRVGPFLEQARLTVANADDATFVDADRQRIRQAYADRFAP